jgi:hypothetical protein
MPIIEGKNVDIIDVHISTIRSGDTVLHNEKLMTVSKNNISTVALLGVTLFGDSYHSGYKPVRKVLIRRKLK